MKKLGSLVASPNSLIHTPDAIGSRLNSMEFHAMSLEIKLFHIAIAITIAQWISSFVLFFSFLEHYGNSMEKIKQNENMHLSLSTNFWVGIHSPIYSFGENSNCSSVYTKIEHSLWGFLKFLLLFRLVHLQMSMFC